MSAVHAASSSTPDRVVIGLVTTVVVLGWFLLVALAVSGDARRRCTAGGSGAAPVARSDVPEKANAPTRHG